MVNIAILFPKNLENIVNRIIYTFTDFVSKNGEWGLYDGYRKYRLFQKQLNKNSKLIKSLIWIKEHTLKKNHIIFTLRNNISDPLIHLGIILTCKLSHKCIFLCSGKDDLTDQLKFLFKILDSGEKEIYVLLDDINEEEEFLDIKEALFENFKKKNMRLVEIFPISKELIHISLDRIVGQSIKNMEELKSRTDKWKELQWEVMGKSINFVSEKFKDIERNELLKYLYSYSISKILTFILEQGMQCKDQHIKKIEHGREPTFYYFEKGIVECDWDEDKVILYEENSDIFNILEITSEIIDKQDLIYWVETLPYPLASILWEFLVEFRTREKVRILLNFFESFTSFITIIMLSSFYFDKRFYIQDWIEEDSKEPDWVKAPTFGSWQYYFARCAKIIRKKLQGKEYLEMSNLPEDFIKIISKASLSQDDGPINVSREIRNKISHNPNLPNKFYEESFISLEKGLNQLSIFFGEIFSNLKLVKPISSNTIQQIPQKIYRNELFNLTGTRTPFKKEVIETKDNLVLYELSLYDKNSKKSLKILPFLQINSEGHCFFYNKLNKDNHIEWKSYISKGKEYLDSEFKDTIENELKFILKQFKVN